jgi:alcohol dehydrogenase (NADP+)
MAVSSADGGHSRRTIQRRALGPKDVAIELAYCGICHSDIHTAREHWGPAAFPLVTGHEMAGVVMAVGSAVTRFRPGARVGVGCMVGSCRTCAACQSGQESYCDQGAIWTYGAKDRDGSITQGGYSTFNVVDEDFVIAIPDAIRLEHAGPLLCAGITVYSPMRRWGVGPGRKVGIVGLGGLGHMATQIAAALGAEVTVLTTTPAKAGDARRFGARTVIAGYDSVDLVAHRRTLDFVLDTAPYRHDFDRIIPLLKIDATYCIVGVGKVSEPNQIGPFSLLGSRNSLASSATGGIRETQELVDFCARQRIAPEISLVPTSAIDDAWAKVVAKEARYRFVIDLGRA